MVYIKIYKRENGTVAGVTSQGHSNSTVDTTVATLMQACGRRLEATKSGLMEISGDEACVISSVKQSKPALAMADMLVDGIELLAKNNPFCVQIQYSLS